MDKFLKDLSELDYARESRELQAFTRLDTDIEKYFLAMKRDPTGDLLDKYRIYLKFNESSDVADSYEFKKTINEFADFLKGIQSKMEVRLLFLFN